MTVLTNSFEGITPSGTVVTTGNSGGASGDAFNSVFNTSSTVQSDSTHAAHGGLGLQFATAGTAANYFVQWSTSMGSLTQVWFRFYLYLTANPATEIRFFEADPASGAGGIIKITTTGKVAFADSASTDQITSTASLTLNAWNRVEGFVLASATVGQVEFKLFLGANSDGAVPDETKTSAATLNTSAGPLTRYIFGNNGTAVASFGPVWYDDLGLSSTGYLGPAAVPQAGGGYALPGRTWLRRFHHRQQLPSPSSAVAAATVTQAAVFPVPVPRPGPHRARLGAAGALAAGILAAGIGPPAVPAPHQPPAIAHPAPHRVIWRSGAGVPPAAQRQPFRPATVYARIPHRASWRGGAGQVAAAALPQSSRPLTVWSRPAHRAIWRGGAGLAAAVVPAPGARPVTVYRRVAHRAIWRAAAGTPPAAARQPRIPGTVFIRTPHRAAWRGGQGTVPAAQRQPFRPATVYARKPHGAIWRSVAAAVAVVIPPPPFTVGALTAQTAPTATLAAADKPGGSGYGALYGPAYGGAQSGALTAGDQSAGTLTAGTAPGSTGTTGTQRTGGPS